MTVITRFTAVWVNSKVRMLFALSKVFGFFSDTLNLHVSLMLSNAKKNMFFYVKLYRQLYKF